MTNVLYGYLTERKPLSTTLAEGKKKIAVRNLLLLTILKSRKVII